MRNKAMLVLVFILFQKRLLLTKYERASFFFQQQHSLLAQTGFQMTCWDFGHLENLFVCPDRFPNNILGNWTSKNLFVSPDRFPNDILGFWKSKI